MPAEYQNRTQGHQGRLASVRAELLPPLTNVHIGLAGYFFQQLTGDSGPGATLGDFKGRVAGIGPQIGFLFPVGEAHQGYLNLKAYKDFAAENRAEGYTAWVTLAITPAAPEAPPKRPMIHK